MSLHRDRTVLADLKTSGCLDERDRAYRQSDFSFLLIFLFRSVSSFTFQLLFLTGCLEVPFPQY
jgi:hypothetical protein